MDMTGWKEKLDELLDPQRDAMFDFLERLVSVDSPTSHGAGVDAVGDLLTERLADAGFLTRKIAKPDIPADEIWQKDLGDARMARTHEYEHGPGIAMIGHMDTVFPVGTAAARPFSMNMRDDVATGPGVADMKAGLAAMVFAAMALKKSELLACPLTLMFSADEELGSPTSSKALLAQLPGAFAILCAEPGGLGDKVTLSRKGSGHMRMKIAGRSAHAGRNYKDGASAILDLAHKIIEIDRLVNLSAGRTVNTGLVKGGISANSVAPDAEAAIHITYRTMDDGKFAVQRIGEIARSTHIPGTKCDLSGGLRLYPLERSAQGDELFGLVKEAGRALGMDITGHHYESAAESGFCSSALGIPTICCMGPEGENIHTTDEFLRPSTLLPRTKLLALSALAAARHFGRF